MLGFSRLDDTDDRGERRLVAGLGLLFAGVLALALVDLAGDLEEGGALWHVALEAAVALIGLSGATAMLLRLRTVARRAIVAEQRAEGLAQRADDLAERLRATERDAERWRAEAGELIAGLSGAIDQQLDRWSLSPAEKEIALLLLKGLSHKEIAEVRGVGEATVRHQARAIYRKAGLSGRADLAAFFLEDLLSVRPSSAGSASPRSTT